MNNTKLLVIAATNDAKTNLPGLTEILGRYKYTSISSLTWIVNVDMPPQEFGRLISDRIGGGVVVGQLDGSTVFAAALRGDAQTFFQHVQARAA